MPPNLFQAIPSDLSEEVFECIAESDSVRIERIISKGHTSPASGWYDQDQHEWVVVLKGEAKIEIQDEGEQHLLPGSHLNIPAHQRHRVTWTRPDTETIWLTVHYS